MGRGGAELPLAAEEIVTNPTAGADVLTRSCRVPKCEGLVMLEQKLGMGSALQDGQRPTQFGKRAPHDIF